MSEYHDIMNKVFEIKSDLKDNDFKELCELISKTKDKKDKKDKNTYRVMLVVPKLKRHHDKDEDDDHDLECTTEVVTICVKMSDDYFNKINSRLKQEGYLEYHEFMNRYELELLCDVDRGDDLNYKLWYEQVFSFYKKGEEYDGLSSSERCDIHNRHIHTIAFYNKKVINITKW